jgi:dTMP kinase
MGPIAPVVVDLAAGIVKPMSRPAEDSSWLRSLAGRFLVFDGPDGSGKSTQIARFAAHCRAHGVDVVEVREPGGTSIGEQIRRVLLDPANTEMSLRCEMMLYMASRSQLIEETIRPALTAGKFVLADRFISSTLAYQGTAGGMTREEILSVGRVAVGDLWPDLTVIFDVDEATAASRLRGGGTAATKSRAPATAGSLFDDRMEQKDADFHRRVRQGYLDQAKTMPDKYLVIDARGEADAVFQSLADGLRHRVPAARPPVARR